MSTQDDLIKSLKKKAVEMRLDLLEMLEPGKVGHLGGSSSATDIVATLYFHKMNYSLKNANDPDRDFFLMSKGHAVPAQYAALAEAGFFSRDEFPKMKTLGGMLQGHPDMKTPGMEAVTGSLGQGLSIGAGIAYAKKRMNKAQNKVYVMCGDGEMAEGQLWEAAAFAATYELSNLTMILDQNGLQACGSCVDIMNIPNLPDKWAAFGWEVIEIDGHDFSQIIEALDRDPGSKPKAIIAHTIKGKGFPFAENVVGFHNGAMTKEQHEEGKKALLAVKEALK
ncbi:transketolase [Marispirochaeta aestuarii]|uniref:Transketolase n=1 Tax=Marispirochaeta aestuarii TaxID=1963862 RepID=A0A1Y1S3E6_9SPIO|nr:transketolase [Marispirochaeta aestuarii]ORC38433.1 transketolase [Marispirochaeta aestuarii]